MLDRKGQLTHNYWIFVHLLTLLLTFNNLINTFLYSLGPQSILILLFISCFIPYIFHSYNIIQFCTKLSLRPLFLFNYHHFPLHIKPNFIFFSNSKKNLNIFSIHPYKLFYLPSWSVELWPLSFNLTLL